MLYIFLKALFAFTGALPSRSIFRVKKIRETAPTCLLPLASLMATIPSVFAGTYVPWKMLYSCFTIFSYRSMTTGNFTCSIIHSHTWGSLIAGNMYSMNFAMKGL